MTAERHTQEGSTVYMLDGKQYRIANTTHWEVADDVLYLYEGTGLVSVFAKGTWGSVHGGQWTDVGDK